MSRTFTMRVVVEIDSPEGLDLDAEMAVMDWLTDHIAENEEILQARTIHIAELNAYVNPI